MLRYFFKIKLLLCIQIKNVNLVTLHQNYLFLSVEEKTLALFVLMPA